MNAKKVLAMVLATTMVVGSSMTVLAESSEGTTAGTGAVEGYVDTDVFQVVLPTETSFSFIIDPQGLIAATTAAAYSGSTFESGATLFFANTDGTYDYSSTSDTYTITNKSSVDVDVTVAATLTDYDGIEVSDSSTFASSNPAIYLALVSGDTTTAIAESDDKASATLTGSADEAPDGAYSITYSEGKYSYTLDTANEYDFDTYTFNLIGASNANADWSDLTEAAPTVSVTWTVTEHVDAPTFTATSTGLTYTTGSGDAALESITSIMLTLNGKAFDGYNANGTAWSAATDEEGVITFDTKYTAYYTDTTNGYTATVTYENAAGDTVPVDVDEVLKSE